MNTRDVQSTVHTAFSEHAVYLERLCNTSEGMFPQRFTGKIALDYASSGFTNGKGIGRSQSLQTGSEIGDFS